MLRRGLARAWQPARSFWPTRAAYASKAADANGGGAPEGAAAGESAPASTPERASLSLEEYERVLASLPTAAREALQELPEDFQRDVVLKMSQMPRKLSLSTLESMTRRVYEREQGALWFPDIAQLDDKAVGDYQHYDGDDYRLPTTKEVSYEYPIESMEPPSYAERMKNPEKYEIPLREEDERRGWTLTHVLDMGRHTKVTGGGRVFSYSALVIVGNAEGSAGYGYGRGETASDAVAAAKDRAARNVVTLYRWRGDSIGESVSAKFKKCGVRIRALAPNAGYKAGPILGQIFRTFGVTDVAGEFFGQSRNRRKRFEATWRALQTAQPPDLLARKLGLRYYSPDRIWRRGNRSWSFD